MHRLIAFIFILSFCLSGSNAANILGIFTSISRSHIIIHMATIKALVEKGHNVTVITTLTLNEPNASYHHIYIPPSEEDENFYGKLLNNAATTDSQLGSIKHLISANVQRVRMQDKALKHPRFQELLNNPGNHFDLMILGWAFNTYQLGVAAHFKCPAIVSWVNEPSKSLLSLLGNPSAVSSVPMFFQVFNQRMTFAQRVRNFVFSMIFDAVDIFSEYKMSQYYNEHFPPQKYPSYDQVKKNVSLIFCNTHFTEGTIRQLVPGFIEIGGIQVKDRPDPLPKDIRKFLNTAEDGFILFSLGTNIKTYNLPINTTMAMFKVLSKVKQKVLWKWDGSKTPGRSSNIMFRKWLPQDDLLAHPMLRLFITHSGKGSTVEAQHHGVPMLAIPMYGDQFGIARKIQNRGFGRMVNHREISETTFKVHLEDVLYNSSYLVAVLKFSMLYRDRPMTPKQSVVYWAEYVIRHRGAIHMQSAAVHLNFFQRNSLDVLSFLCLVMWVSWVVLREIVNALYAMSFRRKIKSE